MKPKHIFIIALGSSVFLSTMAARDIASAKIYLAKSAFYILSILVFLWGMKLCWVLINDKFSAEKFLKKYKAGLMLAFVLVSVTFISTTPRFRILDDEATFLASAKSLTYEKLYDVPAGGSWHYQNFNPDNNYRRTPLRLPLFPFLTSIINVGIGFIPSLNPFVLNYLILLTLFLITYVLAHEAWGTLWACSALIAIAAQPIVSISATSAHCDLLGLLFMVLSYASFKYYLQGPSMEKLELFWVGLLLLANIRYESIVFVVAGVLVLAPLVRYKDIKSSYAIALTPFFFLPQIWQRLIFPKYQYYNPLKENPLTLGHFANNSMILLRNFFDVLSYRLPYATLINITGLGSLLFFLYLAIRGRWLQNRTGKMLFLFSSICVAGHLFLILAYIYGSFDSVLSARFFLPLCYVLTILFIMALRKILTFALAPYRGLFLCLILVVLYHPVATTSQSDTAITFTREYRIAVDFLYRQKHRNLLMVAPWPELINAHNFGAVSFPCARQKKGEILNNWRRHLYEDVFVFQFIPYDSGLPSPSTSLPSEYKLQSIMEIQNSPDSFIRIAKVIP